MPLASSVRPVVTQVAILVIVITVLLFSTATVWQLMPKLPDNSRDGRPPGCISRARYITVLDNPLDRNRDNVNNDDNDGMFSFIEDKADQIHLTMKEPNTPPESLPSDRYAQYIYQEEIHFSDNCGDDNDDKDDKIQYSERPKQVRRTIILGDTHGNLKEFNKFMEKYKYDAEKDVIILAGDLISKGPQSLELLDRAIEVGAKCVRGNHDDKVIRWRGYLDSLSPKEREALEAEEDVVDDDDDDNDLIRQRHHRHSGVAIPWDLDKNSEHYRLARAMTRAQYNYLRSCPLILTLPRELSIHNLPTHVVHAGIDPRRDILSQQPWVLINVRNVLDDGTPARKKRFGQGWAHAFNQMYSRRHGHRRPSSRFDFFVVYGHDAGRSLNVMDRSVGIDTGCIYGRELTGYVLETGEIMSVRCTGVPEFAKKD
ncbi:hypothetical protein BX616_003880 [Lobosporangium transversale]|uniref:Metallo-dependent phosphatase-like protein n=1 Tax=Lobosporangium transversale TaxID=64571 RepID=A0A1Y2GX94_9FUNG|nr:Metallo-dependent phosphatase-like protein [Lobosporangium transversale]KAF9898554.1 hypothetical protein BX616_003880 [Lobosporangium transversale]ORZ24867.1 Metallo-dependent phosphatase-like protein [Lobosporangium transversale]|eukprot:XP_021883848.1 Metallo-dependent phosphatase-like protein [Lobosporangium transversale]